MDIQQALGVPHEFKAGDKIYLVGPLTQEVKASFVSWYKERVRMILLSMRQLMPKDEWSEQWKNYISGLASGDYSFEGRECTKAMTSFDGGLHLSALLFKCPESEMLELFNKYPQEVQALIEIVSAEAVPQGNAASGDPSKAKA